MRATAAFAALAVTILAASCGSGQRGGSGRSTSTVTVTAPRIELASRTFPAGFVPSVMADATGYVWVVGTGPTGCAAVRVDAASLDMTQFSLPYCSGYVAGDAGHLYMAVGQTQPGTDSDSFHLEVFDTATGRAALMPPTMAVAHGSDRSHLAFAYGADRLWLYNWENSQLVDVSPATGSPLATVAGIHSGGGHAVITTTGQAAWVAEGPGGQRLYRIPEGSSTAAVVYTGPSPGSLLWAQAAGERVWAASATFASDNSFTTRLVAFDQTGRRLTETAPTAVGEADAVYGAGAVWSVGTGGSCRDPLRLWRTDAVSGATRVVTNLSSPVDGCLAVGPDHLAVLDGHIFVLETTGSASPAAVLYRVDAG